jgi:hypothetical protein
MGSVNMSKMSKFSITKINQQVQNDWWQLIYNKLI